MTLDDQLHNAFASAVADLGHPDRWQEVIVTGRRRRRHRRIAAAGSAVIVLAAVVGLVVALAGSPSTTRVKVAPAHGSRPTTGTPPGTARPAPTTATPRAAAPATAVPTAATPTTATPTTATPTAPPPSSAHPSSAARTNSPASAASAPVSFPYMPLFPYATRAQADGWLSAYRTSGVQPWHEDPGATALAFVAFLGYTNVNKVTGSSTTSTQAHISVGYLVTPSLPHTAAVIHLVRYGPSPDAPWEVVGTDDSSGFTITSPAYGTVAPSPIVAGGQITGVDESITVQVRALPSPNPVGGSCCHPAGGTLSPWTVPVPFRAAGGQVLIVSAATGGHVAAVERFVVTGVRD